MTSTRDSAAANGAASHPPAVGVSSNSETWESYCWSLLGTLLRAAAIATDVRVAIILFTAALQQAPATDNARSEAPEDPTTHARASLLGTAILVCVLLPVLATTLIMTLRARVAYLHRVKAPPPEKGTGKEASAVACLLRVLGEVHLWVDGVAAGVAHAFGVGTREHWGEQGERGDTGVCGKGCEVAAGGSLAVVPRVAGANENAASERTWLGAVLREMWMALNVQAGRDPMGRSWCGPRHCFVENASGSAYKKTACKPTAQEPKPAPLHGPLKPLQTLAGHRTGGESMQHSNPEAFALQAANALQPRRDCTLQAHALSWLLVPCAYVVLLPTVLSLDLAHVLVGVLPALVDFLPGLEHLLKFSVLRAWLTVWLESLPVSALYVLALQQEMGLDVVRAAMECSLLWTLASLGWEATSSGVWRRLVEHWWGAFQSRVLGKHCPSSEHPEHKYGPSARHGDCDWEQSKEQMRLMAGPVSATADLLAPGSEVAIHCSTTRPQSPTWMQQLSGMLNGMLANGMGAKRYARAILRGSAEPGMAKGLSEPGAIVEVRQAPGTKIGLGIDGAVWAQGFRMRGGSTRADMTQRWLLQGLASSMRGSALLHWLLPFTRFGTQLGDCIRHQWLDASVPAQSRGGMGSVWKGRNAVMSVHGSVSDALRHTDTTEGVLAPLRAIPAASVRRELEWRPPLQPGAPADEVERAVLTASRTGQVKFPNQKLGTAGAEAAGRALRMAPAAVTMLDLSGNGIGARGADALLPVLQGMIQLKYLELSWNGLGLQGIKSISQGLRCLVSLRFLGLRGNQVPERGVSSLLQGLAGGGELAALELQWNELGDEGVTKLLTGLKSSGKLRRVALEQNGLTGVAVIAVPHWMQEQRVMVELGIDSSPDEQFVLFQEDNALLQEILEGLLECVDKHQVSTGVRHDDLLSCMSLVVDVLLAAHQTRQQRICVAHATVLQTVFARLISRIDVWLTRSAQDTALSREYAARRKVLHGELTDQLSLFAVTLLGAFVPSIRAAMRNELEPLQRGTTLLDRQARALTRVLDELAAPQAPTHMVPNSTHPSSYQLDYLLSLALSQVLNMQLHSPEKGAWKGLMHVLVNKVPVAAVHSKLQKLDEVVDKAPSSADTPSSPVDVQQQDSDLHGLAQLTDQSASAHADSQPDAMGPGGSGGGVQRRAGGCGRPSCKDSGHVCEACIMSWFLEGNLTRLQVDTCPVVQRPFDLLSGDVPVQMHPCGCVVSMHAMHTAIANAKPLVEHRQQQHRPSKAPHRTFLAADTSGAGVSRGAACRASGAGGSGAGGTGARDGDGVAGASRQATLTSPHCADAAGDAREQRRPGPNSSEANGNERGGDSPSQGGRRVAFCPVCGGLLASGVAAGSQSGSHARQDYSVDKPLVRLLQALLEVNVVDRAEVEEVGHMIGLGGQGHVIRGRWRGRTVAIKVLCLDYSNCQRMRSLVKLVGISQLAAGICGSVNQLLGVAWLPDRLWMLQELCDERLVNVVNRTGGLPDADVALLVLELASTCRAMHTQAGIVHRDLSPDNVLLLNRQVIVIDFGIADLRASLTRDSQAAGPAGCDSMSGKVLYAPPEQGPQGDRARLSRALDVYAIGATAVFAASNRHPFGGNVQTAIVSLYAKHQPMQVPEHLDPELATLISSMVTLDPQSRPPVDEVVKTSLKMAKRLAYMEGPDRRRYLQPTWPHMFHDLWEE